MTFDDTFAFASQGSQDNGPTMQWATGLAATNRQIITGWLIPTAQDDDLDTTLLGIDTPRVTIKHGSGKTVTHWHLDRAELLLVATDVNGPNGVWFAWQQKNDGRGQSKLKARVYVRALVEAGYRHSLLISLKSTLTGDMRKAFNRLYDMSKATQKSIPIYAWWLPTMAGADVERGKGQTKIIAPVVADVPDTPSRDWLVNQYAARDKQLLAQVEGELPSVMAWSAETATDESEQPAPHDEPPQAEPQSAPPKPSNAPKTPAEAEQRFFNKFKIELAEFANCTPADLRWSDVCAYLGKPATTPPPTTIDAWYAVAKEMLTPQAV
jgi:cell division septation protein DedD